jgi:hypothetical protein
MWVDHGDYSETFKGIMKEHDERYNPTGVPYKLKRSAAEPLSATVDSRAVSRPGVEGVTKETLQTKGNLAVVLGSEPFYEILVCKDGNLWLHALNDGVVSDQVALCGLGDYKYTLGEDADKVTQGEGAHVESTSVTCAHPLHCAIAQRRRCQLVPIQGDRRPVEGHLFTRGDVRNHGEVPHDAPDLARISDLLGKELASGGLNAQPLDQAGGVAGGKRGPEFMGVQDRGGENVRAPHLPDIFIYSPWSKACVEERGRIG